MLRTGLMIRQSVSAAKKLHRPVLTNVWQMVMPAAGLHRIIGSKSMVEIPMTYAMSSTQEGTIGQGCRLHGDARQCEPPQHQVRARSTI
jgi:hypothetical protein